MRSIRFGRIMGISLEMHSTFILLLVLVVIFLLAFDPANLVPLLVLFFFLFVSVFIHELFHSFVAISKGSRVEKIILLPIGGVAVTEEMPEKPLDEFLLALAGPLFNFAVVFAILALVYAFPNLPWPWHVFTGDAGIEAIEPAILQYPLFGLFWVNLVLGAFNLFVPALPLDGGRALRAALAAFVGFDRATHIATKLSQILAIAMGIIGLFVNWILLIIAFFVYFGAGYENEVVLAKELLRGVPLSGIISRRPLVIDAGQSIREAFDEMLRQNKTVALVDLHSAYGYVDVDMLGQVDKQRWESGAVGVIAQKLPQVSASESTAGVVAKIIGKKLPLLPVVEHGELVGVIEESEINKLYKLEKVFKKR